MNTQVGIYSRRSLCPCGAPVLHDRVKLGTAFVTLNPEQAPLGWLQCCACGFKLQVHLVSARIPAMPAETLPREIFAF